MRPLTRRSIRTLLILISALTLLVTGCGDSESTDETSADSSSVDDAGTDAGTDSDAETDPDADTDTGTDTDPESDESSAGTESSGSDEDAGTESDTSEAEELFPDVLDATADRADDGSWTFSATLSSPYDTPNRYADAWRVIGPDGEVFGIRELTHDHANEQPFTRSHSGIVIPDDITTVTVEGRDQVSGWGGATVEVTLES